MTLLACGRLCLLASSWFRNGIVLKVPVKSAIDVQAFINSLRRDFQPRATAAAIAAVDLFAEVVLGRAVELCPQSPTNRTIESPKTGNEIKNPNYTRHSGELRRSATVEPAKNNGGALITARIGFNTDYAAAVHERLDAFHIPPTRAKFLETAMNELQPKFYDIVVNAIREELDL
jgi:hypothetical protein